MKRQGECESVWERNVLDGGLGEQEGKSYRGGEMQCFYIVLSFLSVLHFFFCSRTFFFLIEKKILKHYLLYTSAAKMVSLFCKTTCSVWIVLKMGWTVVCIKSEMHFPQGRQLFSILRGEELCGIYLFFLQNHCSEVCEQNNIPRSILTTLPGLLMTFWVVNNTC